MASNGYGLLECKIRAMIRAISELCRGGLESLALTGICLSRQVLRGETRSDGASPSFPRAARSIKERHCGLWAARAKRCPNRLPG